MIITQEENNPISDMFYGLNVNEGFRLIKEISEDQFCDSDILKEAINQTVDILHEFTKKIESYEKKAAKENAALKVRERLRRGHFHD